MNILTAREHIFTQLGTASTAGFGIRSDKTTLTIYQRHTFFLLLGFLVLFGAGPLNAANVVSIGGSATGPGSFPYAFTQANSNSNPVTFAPAANSLTCTLQGYLSPTNIIDVDLTGLTS